MPQIDIVNFDKVEHTLFFSIGSGLLTIALALTFPYWRWWTRLAIAVFAVSLTGRLDEWHQSFTPGRSGNDFYDWLADTVGAIVGSGVARWLFLYARTRRLGLNGPADRLAPAATPRT